MSGRPQLTLGLVGSDTIPDELGRIVVDKNEGSRLVVVRKLGEQNKAANAVSDVEVDIIDVLPSIAQGTAIDASSGPLSVEMHPEGPVIRHAEAPSGTITTQTLVKGDGVQVHAGDRVVAQFTVVGWTDGVVRASTWETGIPEVVNLKTAMKGLSETLVDQKVGSRLAITVPPDLAEGDDTLCIVIDVLGTEPPVDEPQSQPQSGPVQ